MMIFTQPDVSGGRRPNWASLPPDARLLKPPPEADGKKVGRPRLVGHRWPNLPNIAVNPTTVRQTDPIEENKDIWNGVFVLNSPIDD
jgi:hypothetical protein